MPSRDPRFIRLRQRNELDEQRRLRRRRQTITALLWIIGVVALLTVILSSVRL